MNATIAAGQLLGLRIKTQFYTFYALSSVLEYLTLHHFDSFNDCPIHFCVCDKGKPISLSEISFFHKC